MSSRSASQAAGRSPSRLTVWSAQRLEAKDFSWDRLIDFDEHALGELVRFPKMGKVRPAPVRT
jgi:hypothetical protein